LKAETNMNSDMSLLEAAKKGDVNLVRVLVARDNASVWMKDEVG